MNKFILALLFTLSNQLLLAQWTPNGSTVYLTNSSNKVGIGSGSGTPQGKVQIYDQGNASGTSLVIGNTSTGLTSLLIGTHSESNGTTYINAIKSSGSAWGNILMNENGGNVGIGTALPNSRLQVNGNFQQINIDNYSGIYLDATATNEPKVGWRVSDNSERFRAHLKGVNTATERIGFFKTLGVEKEVLSILSNENIGIGTSSPDAKLAVNGTIHSKEVRVDLTGLGPDYVFEKDYALPSLNDVKAYIDQNKHLPEVPSAKEMEANGINLSEMNMLLLKKVEELTLYMIELKKEIAQIKENQK